MAGKSALPLPPGRSKQLTEIEDDLTKLNVKIRKSIQEFSLCATFKEVDEQNAAVRGLMDNMRSSIQELDTLATESADKQQADRASEMKESYKEQLVSCQRQFRMANVSQMNQLESDSSRELIGNTQLRQRVKPEGRQGLLSEHSNVTNNLKLISRQLAATVEKSQLTVSNLEGSSKTLQEVEEENRSLTGVIGQSKKLITKYMRREFTDKILIVFALAFFFAVVLYILRKRVFPTYGPLEVVFYLFSLCSNAITGVTSVFA